MLEFLEFVHRCKLPHPALASLVVEVHGLHEPAVPGKVSQRWWVNDDRLLSLEAFFGYERTRLYDLGLCAVLGRRCLAGVRARVLAN